MPDAHDDKPVPARPDVVHPDDIGTRGPVDLPGGGGDPFAALGGAGGGGFDLGGLFDMANEMQQRMAEAQEQAAATELEGQAGGGVVKVRVTGTGEFRAVTIDPQVVDPDDVEMLQDLVLAALNDAMARVNELQAEAMGGAGDALGGMGGLGDLFGPG